MKTLPTTLALAMAALTMFAQAQAAGPACGQKNSPSVPAVSHPHSMRQPYVLTPPDSHYHGGYRAATVAESWAGGQAALARARAQYNLLTSQAMVNAALARAIELENRQRANDRYTAMKKSQKEENNAKRQTQRANYLRTHTTPPPAAPRVFDPATNAVAWPSVLATETYAAHRKAVENAFKKSQAERRWELARATEEILVQLREDMGVIKPSDYVAAKRFLAALGSSASEVMLVGVSPSGR